jgi:hypothetical protein
MRGLGRGWRGRARGGAAAIAIYAVFTAGGAAVQAAAVESGRGPSASGGLVEPLQPPGTWPERLTAVGSDETADLGLLLSAAGFADALLLSAEELSRFGEHFAAGWVAPAGDLIGLLFVVGAGEPRATMGAFVGELERACADRFAETVDRIESLEDRSIGRARAACHGAEQSLHYDMVFHFAAAGTLGIVHIAYDATARRARAINGGLIEIFQSW